MTFTHGFKWLSPVDRRARWYTAVYLGAASKQIRECVASQPFFSLFHSSMFPVYGMVLPIFRVGLKSSANLF